MVRAAARPAWEIASCGAGAAGLKPRVDGVRVELRAARGAAFARPGGARRRFLLLGEPAEETWGAGCASRASPRARAAGAEACT